MMCKYILIALICLHFTLLFNIFLYMGKRYGKEIRNHEIARKERKAYDAYLSITFTTIKTKKTKSFITNLIITLYLCNE